MNAITKSRFQIKPKPITGSSKNAILIFYVTMHWGAVHYFYWFSKEPKHHFTNLDLPNKSQIVHLYCTLMAYRSDMLSAEGGQKEVMKRLTDALKH